MNYPKFYYELNHIVYFQFDRKKWTKRYYKYNFECLRENISRVLAQIKGFIILGYYKSCPKTIQLLKEKIEYKTNEQKKLKSHQKTLTVNNDR